MDPTEQRVNELISRGKWSQALLLIDRWPEQLLTLWVRANCLFKESSDYSSAELLFRRMLELPSCPPEVHLRLGQALHEQDHLVEALQHYLQVLVACRGQPGSNYEHAVNSYGLACLELGLGEHWLDVWARLDRRPERLPRAAYLAAIAHLNLCQWSLGWQLFEQRHLWFHRQDGFQCPVWHGQAIQPASTVLISSDMGMGDFLFFLRFVPEFRRRFVDCRVVVLVPPSLEQVALASNLFDEIVTNASVLSGLFPWQLRLASLPACLGVDQPDQFPKSEYLQVPEKVCAAWQEVASSRQTNRPLVAINWAGNRAAESARDTVRRRSLELDQIERLEALQKVELISVQMGVEKCVLQSSLAQCCHPIQQRFSGSAPDLIDTAAVLMCCDLLITNDTSTAHLGGALGLPTWVLLKQNPSWQWGAQGQTPWYDSVRCFRQHRAFDWSGVLSDVDQELPLWIQDWHQYS